jgi:hypothetical protein
MLRNRNQYPSVITPKGTVAWASIDEPDFEYKDGGEFHIRVRFDPDDLKEIEAIGQEILDEAFEAMSSELKKEKKGALLKKLHKRDVIQMETDRETGDETGYAIIRAGKTFRVTPKNGKNAGKTFEFTPDVFDARGKKLKKRPRVGSGSEVKISVKLMEYFVAKDGEMGIKFELEAVQIIKLIQGGSRDAASYGFAQEEGDAIEDEDTGGFKDEGDGFEAEDEDDNSDF